MPHSGLLKANERAFKLNTTCKQSFVVDSGHADQAGFNHLRFFNDIFLLPGKELHCTAGPGVLEILFPLNGSIVYHDADTRDEFISAEVLLLNDRSGTFTLQNPYERPINYLHMGLSAGKKTTNPLSCQPLALEVLNGLSALDLGEFSDHTFLSAGTFEAGTKSSYALHKLSNGVFIFVVNGAFEANGRRLSTRDAASFYNIKSIDFESLTEDSVLFLLELPITSTDLS